MLDRADALIQHSAMRDGFDKHLDDQAPAVAKGEGETFQEILRSQCTEIDIRLLRLCEGQIQHFIEVFLTGQVDLLEMNGSEQPKQLLLLRDVGGETRDLRKNEHERPPRILQEGLEAVEDLLIGPFAFFREHMPALVEMDADHALDLGVFHHEVPDLGLCVTTLQRVAQRVQDLRPEVLPGDLSRQDAVNDPCGPSVRHDLGAVVELLPQPLDLAGFDLAGITDDEDVNQR